MHAPACGCCRLGCLLFACWFCSRLAAASLLRHSPAGLLPRTPLTGHMPCLHTCAAQVHGHTPHALKIRGHPPGGQCAAWWLCPTRATACAVYRIAQCPLLSPVLHICGVACSWRSVAAAVYWRLRLHHQPAQLTPHSSGSISSGGGSVGALTTEAALTHAGTAVVGALEARHSASVCCCLCAEAQPSC